MKIKYFGRLASNTEEMREAVKCKIQKNDHRKTPLQLKKFTKAPNKEDKIMTTFTLNGTIYSTNEKGNYFYKSTGSVDKKGNAVMTRIPAHVYEQAFEQYIKESADQAKADAEYEERLQKQAESDKAAEDAVNGKKFTRKQVNEAVEKAIEKEMKKAAKPRKSKDIAHESNGVTLTAKQVDFIKHLPDTNFWEDGLDSALWCDVLADEIGGQFAGKPMTVGAMISTLREKELVTVGRDLDRKGKPKFMQLTDLGKQVAKELGLE